jgi:putative N6-adenine-specific DNA methylase
VARLAVTAAAAPAAAALGIFLVAAPGLEALLAEEAAQAGFEAPAAVPGGVRLQGGWDEVWRANLQLRGATRVLVRVGGFRALHLAQLDRRLRRFPWGALLRPDRPVRVEAAARASRIWHAGAVAARVEAALSDGLGVPVAAEASAAAVRVLARLDDDLCTLSLDSSGEPLHRRGHKEAVGKAPLRENLAALFLRAAGYRGQEPVLDPMCGSGSFVIEAAEIAAGLAPGRSRRFAFEEFATFDPARWQALRAALPPPRPVAWRSWGSDRDAGAVAMARANAVRAGVEGWVDVRAAPVSEIEPPEGPPGLVIVNPPYGERIGVKESLRALHGALGARLRARFSGWRVALVTSEPTLAAATGLPFGPPGPPVPHGGLRVRLHRTEGPLP